MRAYSLDVGAAPEARLPPPADQARSAPKRRSSSFAPLGAAVAVLLVLVAASGWYLLGGHLLKTLAFMIASGRAESTLVSTSREDSASPQAARS
jgi:hypothetical protein